MVTWDLLDEPWDSLGTWVKIGTGTSEISPAGQLHNIGYAGRQKDNDPYLPDKYTVESRLKINVYGGLGWEWWFYSKTPYAPNRRLMALRIAEHKIINRSALLIDEYSIENLPDTWYIWRFIVDGTVPEVKIYRDDVYIHTFTELRVSSIQRINLFAILYCEGHEDYLKIASGLHEPSPTEYTNKEDCEGRGWYYWWDGACHANRSPHVLRAEKIAELHRLYGGGPYTDEVKEAYSDVLVEVSQYNEDGTWDSHNRRGRTIGDRGYKDE